MSAGHAILPPLSLKALSAIGTLISSFESSPYPAFILNAGGIAAEQCQGPYLCRQDMLSSSYPAFSLNAGGIAQNSPWGSILTAG